MKSIMTMLLPVFGGKYSWEDGDWAKVPSSPWSAQEMVEDVAKTSNILTWAYAIIGVLGVVAIVVGAYLLVTGLLSKGTKHTNWVMVIALLMLGGIMTFGGWNMFAATLAAGAMHTVGSW